MLDKFLIKYASPTLGKIKTGSLFKVSKNTKINLEYYMKYYNSLLNNFDLYLEIIYSCDKYSLIYIYNKEMLINDIKNKNINNFLRTYGYRGDFTYDYIIFLKERFCTLKKTPHEIGIFLGYPLDDVKCFIKYGGKNFKLLGCWKVYDDVENCSNKFKEFKNYRDEFTYLYENNYSLKDLIKKKI